MGRALASLSCFVLKFLDHLFQLLQLIISRLGMLSFSIDFLSFDCFLSIISIFARFDTCNLTRWTRSYFLPDHDSITVDLFLLTVTVYHVKWYLLILNFNTVIRRIAKLTMLCKSASPLLCRKLFSHYHFECSQGR